MLVEAGVVGAARRGGVPVPELIDARRRDDGMAFMVLEAIEGETIARKIQRDDDYADARSRLVADFGHALAKIHALDPDAIDGLEATDQLAYYTDVLDSLGQPHPVLELVRNWLVDNRPTFAADVCGARRLPSGQRDSRPRRSACRDRLGAGPSRRPDGGPRLALRERRGGSVVVPRSPDSASTTSCSRPTRTQEAFGDRSDGGALVGSARHLEVGDHVHPAGQRAPRRDHSKPRAGRDRPSGVRERTRPLERSLEGRW
jgi:hypothetical protein